jgi:hypothetical protein
MALATYDDLKLATANWLNRDDLVGNVPDFIEMAESRINDRLRVAPMETTATTFLAGGSVALPSDFLEARRVFSNAEGGYATALTPLSPIQAGDTYPSGSAGVPVHYTIVGDTLSTFPNGGDGQVTMTYYAKLPPLAAYGTNWLLTRNPSVYLYGALIEAVPFLGDDGRIETWASLFAGACDALQAADQRSRYASSTCRVKGETP